VGLASGGRASRWKLQGDLLTIARPCPALSAV
jgi:hypothetical protein